jgi:excinuclease ABC subunit B
VNLVDYGFRLQAAIDNRPLKFEEFTEIIDQTIYVSATPADYELEKSEGIIAEQIIRPTGLLDPEIFIHPSLNQIDDLLEEITVVTEREERTLVTTLTKRMAEELDKFLTKMGVRCRYIHSDVDTLERVEILADLRNGLFDVLVGVNLLREGLDLPEVSLVAILDADKEGFLRSERSLVQTVGRAARNVNGKVIMYADRITNSMQKTIDETIRRRAVQLKHNQENGIVPTQVLKPQRGVIGTGTEKTTKGAYEINDEVGLAADPVVQYMSKSELELSIERVKSKMFEEAKKENFIEAAVLRDEMFSLKKMLIEKMN